MEILINPEEDIFEIKSEIEFERAALKIFLFQSERNEVFRHYLEQLRIDPRQVSSVRQIPFLPVEFFKTHNVRITHLVETGRSITFSSSGTTGSVQSRHEVADVSIYEKSFLKCFNQFYGNPVDYCILALLPSYLERKGSSLIYMMNDLVEKSNHPLSGFYLDDFEKLFSTLQSLKKTGQKTILTGVSFALLDFIEKFPLEFPELIVMETGGMKGRRKELVREELHSLLKKGFGVNAIHSEYGMTELLSQAYSRKDGTYASPPWMKIIIRDMNDPFTLSPERHAGGINIIDLANVYSCAFIASEDLGKSYDDGTFEVLGRFDNSDIRGCNLMAV